MTAYKRLIDRDCDNCPRKAHHEVFNRFNASMGFFCDKCADHKVKFLDEQERNHERERI